MKNSFLKSRCLLFLISYSLILSVVDWWTEKHGLLDISDNFVWSTSFQNQEPSDVLNWNLVFRQWSKETEFPVSSVLVKNQAFVQMVEYWLMWADFEAPCFKNVGLRLSVSPAYSALVPFLEDLGFSSFGYWKHFYVSPRSWATEIQFSLLLTLWLKTWKIMASVSKSTYESL